MIYSAYYHFDTIHHSNELKKKQYNNNNQYYQKNLDYLQKIFGQK